jgi:hypothetical protein
MDYDNLPKFGKVSPTACLGGRTVRPLCGCCGGSDGVRRAKRKFNRHTDDWRDGNLRRWNSETRGVKPRYKDKR